MRVLMAFLVLTGAASAEAATTWRDAASDVLRAAQAMPRSAVVRRATCAARVRVAVDGNGLITRYDIVKPCAEPILTRSTDDLFFKVGQLPPPPARRPTSIEIEVRWPPKG
ncbi:hypothetical protein [Sphingosinicella soli]|uniref:Outer membrane biosynthesis protein TonB n=1 Tax=Sphingosinicella soli TaxID=333708 RepID=A0A7W7B3E8_9SPHN|nr:hypothetical protein [Sphingosinicella soli]MBB4633179.1 outer membrane biosynthesis protein TonB [Sphingosinicella soli]